MSELSLAEPSMLTEVAETLVDDGCASESSDRLSELLNEIQSIIPPLWPLKDYVAVNPFFGLAQHCFLHARQLLCEVRKCDLLMPRSYFRSLLKNGPLSADDIQSALNQCHQEYPEQYAGLSSQDVIDWVENSGPDSGTERLVHTVAETLDGQLKSTWTSHIINDISRHLAAHYDEGQAVWQSPWKSQPLYEAWRDAAVRSRRMEQLGMRGFRQFVSQLPSSPQQAIEQILQKLKVPRSCWRSFLLCELFSVSGWASYIRYRSWKPGAPVELSHDLLGLLAIRLSYDASLAETSATGCLAEKRAVEIRWPEDCDGSILAPPMSVVARYCLHVATENAYRRSLCSALTRDTVVPADTDRRQLQMIFCIDVRSEVFRRNLESVDNSIETFGFAGFFGMSMEYVPLGATSGAAQCPVLLNPAFQIHQTIRGADETTLHAALDRRRTIRTMRKVWKSFQSSAASCFSFVESIGLVYLAKLLTDSVRLSVPVPNAEADGMRKHHHESRGPHFCSVDHSGLSRQQKATLAENMLRNLGLTQAFARIVAICGHASDVVNNPYKAGLDCGACGGHSGEPNARLAASLLNNAEVRQDLAQRGIVIPHDTWFVPAIHNTTTDEILFLDVAELPEEFTITFQRVQSWTQEAGRLCRVERAPRLGTSVDHDVFRRSRDWAEVRPEWGLAGNAAFIVAPRSRTARLNLSGRTFMHSYDHRNDPELKVLELIMTAPMVVTSWINLQYYASAVDNRAFGSGNKLIHNVVGQFGVFEGNAGDLMTGLPWQSVHDGEQFQHEPLRLLVMIEAPRSAVRSIIEKHSHVRDLVTNGWLSLVVLDGCEFHRWTALQTWEEHSMALRPAPRTD